MMMRHAYKIGLKRSILKLLIVRRKRKGNRSAAGCGNQRWRFDVGYCLINKTGLPLRRAEVDSIIKDNSTK